MSTPLNLPTILLITKDPELRRLLTQAAPNLYIQTVRTVAEGLDLWPKLHPLLVITEGHSMTLTPLLEYTHRLKHSSPLLVVGEEHDSVKDAVEIMRAGAADYLTKPLRLTDVQTAIGRLLEQPRPIGSNPQQDPFASIISVSPQMNLMKQLAREVAQTEATVLITGESGTGKDLFAEAIHRSSYRATGPLIALNCAGIPEHLLEAELFGYEPGAFTDAKRAKPGRFQLAEGGTLFLDEIGELSPTAQAKLLRVLETHMIDPLGDTRSHKVDIRIIAATNEDLLAQIKTGRFRLDLYYRLNIYQLRIPSLRERLDDIEPILVTFLGQARKERGCRIQGIAASALTLLHAHSWPGNVRELHNVVDWLTITCKDDVIQPHHLPASVTSISSPASLHAEPRHSLLAFGLSFQDMEKQMLEEALHQTSGNISEASRLLKLTRNTLRYRMAKYNLS